MSRSGFEEGGVEVARSTAVRVRTRGFDMRPYKAQWLVWRCPVATCFHSFGYGDAVAGMVA
jgi:hypothetical protein